MAFFPFSDGNRSLRSEALLDLDNMLNVIRERVAIGVVYTGDPNAPQTVIERTANARPWKSYREVSEQIAEALRASGFKMTETVAEGPELRQALDRRKYQLLWLNTAGVQGKSPTSHAPALLESLGYPYVGHTPLQAALLDDKILLKQWLRGVGLPTASFITRAGGYRDTVSRVDPDYAREFGPHYAGPYLLKPALGRGSVNVRVVDDISSLDRMIAELTRETNDRVIIEQFLPGQEYCVWASRGIQIVQGKAVARQLVMTFGMAERLFPFKERIFLKKERQDAIADPSRLLSDKEERLRDDLSYVARVVHTGLGLFVPIRLDLRLDQSGRLLILEVNPKPDLKRPDSREMGLFAAALADISCSYEDFVLKILADWLDFHVRYSPASLAMLSPLFERYGSPAPRRDVLPR
jgi:D-alanine-D-alanine ligase